MRPMYDNVRMCSGCEENNFRLQTLTLVIFDPFLGLMLHNYTRHIVDFPEEEIPWEDRRPHYGEDWYYF